MKFYPFWYHFKVVWWKNLFNWFKIWKIGILLSMLYKKVYVLDFVKTDSSLIQVIALSLLIKMLLDVWTPFLITACYLKIIIW